MILRSAGHVPPEHLRHDSTNFSFVEEFIPQASRIQDGRAEGS